jgi:hypothetical protein
MHPSNGGRPPPREAGGGSQFEQLGGRLDQRIDQNRRESNRTSRPDLNAEARIQAAIVAFVRAVAPQVLIFADPNGGLRTQAEAARLKWTGVLAGVPDLVVIGPGGRALFLEVKTETGSLSASQREMFDRLTSAGTAPAIVRWVDDVRAAFRAWNIETMEAQHG